MGGIQSHTFTATDASSGTERISLSPGRLVSVGVSAGAATPRVSVQMGRFGTTHALVGMDGYLHRSLTDLTSHGLTWEGSLPVASRGAQLLIAWDNRTGSNVNIVVEWEVE